LRGFPYLGPDDAAHRLRQSAMEAQSNPEPVCRHHWILGAPVDGTVQGRCKKCGESRTYPAVIDDYDRGDEASEQRLSNVTLAATAAGGARASQPEEWRG